MPTLQADRNNERTKNIFPKVLPQKVIWGVHLGHSFDSEGWGGEGNTALGERGGGFSLQIQILKKIFFDVSPRLFGEQGGKGEGELTQRPTSTSDSFMLLSPSRTQIRDQRHPNATFQVRSTNR